MANKAIGDGKPALPRQVKSKERVTEHGEVFTNEREVNAMLDMVKQETERIESRFGERSTVAFRVFGIGQILVVRHV